MGSFSLNVRQVGKLSIFDKRDFQIIATIITLLALRLLLYAVIDRHVQHFAEDLCQWDCHWYIHTVDDGYDSHPRIDDASFGQANWVNFPAFPVFIRVISFVFRIPSLYAGFFAANISFCVFLFFSVKYLDQCYKNLNFIAIIMFMVSYPYSFYYSLVYSESLYAAFTMLSFYFFYQKRFLASSISAAFLSATRVTGVTFTLIIIAVYVNQFVVSKQKTIYLARDIALSSILSICLAPLGLFIFMAFLYWHMGDAYAFAHVQIAWNRAEENPLKVLWAGLTSYDLQNSFSYSSHSEMFAAFCGVFGLILSIRLLTQRKFAEGWFLGSTIILALSEGLIAFPRYCLANPIFMTALFEYIWLSGLRKFFPLIVILFVLLQLMLIQLWFHAYVSLI